MARLADVVHNGGAADFTGVVDDDVAKAHQALRDGGLYRYVLHLAQRNVSRRPRDETSIDL